MNGNKEQISEERNIATKIRWIVMDNIVGITIRMIIITIETKIDMMIHMIMTIEEETIIENKTEGTKEIIIIAKIKEKEVTEKEKEAQVTIKMDKDMKNIRQGITTEDIEMNNHQQLGNKKLKMDVTMMITLITLMKMLYNQNNHTKIMKEKNLFNQTMNLLSMKFNQINKMYRSQMFLISMCLNHHKVKI